MIFAQPNCVFCVDLVSLLAIRMRFIEGFIIEIHFLPLFDYSSFLQAVDLGNYTTKNFLLSFLMLVCERQFVNGDQCFREFDKLLVNARVHGYWFSCSPVLWK